MFLRGFSLSSRLFTFGSALSEQNRLSLSAVDLLEESRPQRISGVWCVRVRSLRRRLLRTGVAKEQKAVAHRQTHRRRVVAVTHRGRAPRKLTAFVLVL